MIASGTFKVGDKIRCVKKLESYYQLTVGKEYVVSEDSQLYLNSEFVGIEFDDEGDGGHSFEVECFKKI